MKIISHIRSDAFYVKWWIAFKIVPLLGAIIFIKIIAHWLGFEFLELNALFTSIVAGTVFLLGFLTTGVLTDYKESEKIPGELSVALEALHDDAYTIWKAKDSKAARSLLTYLHTFIPSIYDWFYRKKHAQDILQEVSDINEFFIDLDKEGIPPNILIKMKTAQSDIRKLFIRIHTIRDTFFIPSAFAIVEVLTAAITVGMIVTKIDPFYEAIFFILLVDFLLIYMIYLIKDLEDPFNYAGQGEAGTEISLKPFHDVREKLTEEKLK